jgi:hypothetical protein
MSLRSAISLAARLALLACPSFVAAAELHVDLGAPPGGDGSPERPYQRIADAIASAANGDTIRIAPGRYVENLLIDRDLRLLGSPGPEWTRIDGGLAGRVIDAPIPLILELEDLVLERGAASSGAGVRAIGAVLRLRRVRIERCEFGNALSGGLGGGLLQQGGSLELDACAIVENRAFAGSLDVGAGLGALFARVALRDCLIAGNRSAAASAISIFGDLELRGCTLADNSSEAIVLSRGDLLVENSILWGNGGASIQLYGQTSAAVQWSDIEGGFAGAGTFAADPRFVDRAAGDYRLRPDSPCLDAGDPTAVPRGTDLLGAPRFLDGDQDGAMRRDLGAFERSPLVLVASGSSARGAELRLDVSGEAGWLAALWCSGASSELWFPPAGALLFDPAHALPLVAGAAPLSLALLVPHETPYGATLHFQAFGLAAAPATITATNRVVVRVR